MRRMRGLNGLKQAQLQSGATGLNVGLMPHYLPFFIYAGSERHWCDHADVQAL